MASKKNNLVDQANFLRSQAQQVITDFGIEDILKPYGQVHFVGSYALNLMVWEDIDLNLFIEKEEQIEKAYWKITKHVSKLNEVKLLLMVNNLTIKKELNRPKSMYLGIKYQYQEKTWKFDIRFLKPEDDNSLTYLHSLEKNLNKMHRIKILYLKNHFKDQPEYGKVYSAFDIYQAVIDKNITTIKEFEKYLDS